MKPVFEKKVGLAELQGMVKDTNTVERKRVIPAPAKPEVFAQPQPTKSTVDSSPVVESSPAAQADARYVEVGDILPSKCLVYTEKSVAVRPFEVPEINKIHRAIVEKTIRHEVDAMSACLSISAYQLTLGDFYWLMYWEYVNSYKRMPKTVSWRCSNPEHLEKVVSLETGPETLQNTEVITNSHLKEEALDIERVNLFAEKFYTEYGLYLDLPRVSDLVETENETDNDTEWYNKYAALISRQHYGATTKQRREYLKGWFKAHSNPDVLMDFEDWIELTQHGVQEEVTVTCKECGATDKVELSVTPLSFLPVGKQRNR